MNRTVLLAGHQIELVFRPLHRGMDDVLLASLSPEEKTKFESITHPARKVEWSEGRRALRQLSPSTLTRSLAHTREGAAGVALAAGSSDAKIRGVGVDVEIRTRVISESVTKWLVQDSERQLPLTSLLIWMVKEACFKADPEQGDDFTLQAYEIISSDQNGGRARAKIGHPREFQFALSQEGDWLVAIAICEARSD